MNLRRALLPTLTMLALLGLHQLSLHLPNVRGATRLKNTMTKLRSRDLNSKDLDALTAGYYQELLSSNSQSASSSNLLVRFGLAEGQEAERALIAMDSMGRQPAPFVLWEQKPNVNIRLPGVIGARLQTNSQGLADQEYSLDKPPGTWRIALLGDSVARGWGVAPENDFESLLESYLNEHHRNPRIRNYEILNMAVGGYRITQMLGTAVDKAPRYHPDVYMACISDLAVLRRWGYHIGLLVQTGADLRFDFLRRLVREADLRRDDDLETVTYAKLAPHRLRTIQWVFSEMKAQAERDHATLVVVLLASANQADLVRSGFEGIPRSLHEIGVPVVDLTDTFEKYPDLERFRISATDRHPNERGHQLLFENLYGKISRDPALAARIFGDKPGAAAAAAAAR